MLQFVVVKLCFFVESIHAMRFGNCMEWNCMSSKYNLITTLIWTLVWHLSVVQRYILVRKLQPPNTQLVCARICLHVKARAIDAVGCVLFHKSDTQKNSECLFCSPWTWTINTRLASRSHLVPGFFAQFDPSKELLDLNTDSRCQRMQKLFCS